MTPQERELLEGLFERIRAVSAGPRDAEAEAFIAQAVRTTPTAPYLLSQTVIVQEEALKAAAQRIEELQAQVDDAARRASEPAPSFLGGIGKSLFGGEGDRPRGSVPSAGAGRAADAPSGARWTQQGQPVDQPQTFGGQPMGAPGGTGQGGMGPGGMGPGGMGQAAGGGSFLKGAMGAAAGVAGGMLLANSLSGLFKQNNPLGIASGGADKAGDKNAAGALDDKSATESGAGDSGWGAKRDEQATPASHTDDEDEDEGDDGWDDGDDGFDDGQEV